jgi:hypothetical protein
VVAELETGLPGGERRREDIPERCADDGGDAFDVAAFGRREGPTGGFPDGGRSSEQLRGTFVVAGERVGAGEPVEGSRRHADVPTGACGRIAVPVQVAGGARITAQLGDEPELGQDQCRVSVRVDLAVPVEPVAQARLGRVELALRPGDEREPDVGVLLREPDRVLRRQPLALLGERAGLLVVAGQQCDPAEAGRPERRLGPQTQLLGDP